MSLPLFRRNRMGVAEPQANGSNTYVVAQVKKRFENSVCYSLFRAGRLKVINVRSVK